MTLAFGVLLEPQQVHTEGISQLTLADINYARELGYTIKLLAIAKDDNGAIEARVHPTMIAARHLLAGVAGAFNAIYIHGEALGSSMYFGQGAGQMPTATAVMADILEIARHRRAGARGGAHAFGYPFGHLKRARVKPMDDVICEYYLRFNARDKPGVLGAIASVLGRNGISIVSVIQKGRGVETTVPVIMRTHEAREKNLKRALAAIRRLKMVDGAPGLHPNRGASLTAMAESIKAGAAAGARLTRWPGLIEHYRRFLPVTDKTPVVTLNEGNTPLIESPALADRVGQNIKVYLKFEGANPTGSFKDRGMTVAMSKALGEGVRAVICASTGNTSASAAAYAGRAGLQAYVLIPKGAVALGKLSQSLMHGARVVEVIGNFDICLKVVRDVAERDPVRIRLVNSVNPDRIAGQKTARVRDLRSVG